MNPIREITPLTQSDCFTITSRVKKQFDYPLHNHEEMELNLIINGAGAKRVVGDHNGEIGDLELVLIGSNLNHGWFNHKCKSKEIKEITLQFHKDLFDEKFLKRNQMSNIRLLFEQSRKGVIFSRETILELSPRLQNLHTFSGFSSVLELMSLLHELSISKGVQMLSDASLTIEEQNSGSRRIERVFEYMNTHFSSQVTLTEVAKIAGMPDASFSRFIKHRTGYTFIDSLNEIRLGHVSRMLIDTTYTVAEIASKCGFNNMANFNRTFKSKKGCTPKEFRAQQYGKQVFV